MKIVIIVFFLVGCMSCKTKKYTQPNNEATTLQKVDTLLSHTDIKITADGVIQILKNKQYVELVKLMQPNGQLLFSPYGFIDTATALKFTATSFAKLCKDTATTLLWGAYDGSGEDIQLTLNNYVAQFVFDKPFDQANAVTIDSSVAKGNSIINISKIFPNHQYVEYYYGGSAAMNSMDWASLTLVFNKIEGKYFLVAIIHNQWTI